MKRIKLFVLTSFVLSLLLISNCTKEGESENNAVSSEDQIKEEIIAVGDSIMARFERLDAEGIFQLYSPDFIAFGLYGDKFSLLAYKNECVNLFNSTTTYKWTPYSLDFLVITQDMVVVSQDGKNETIMKSGSKLIFDPSHYTFIFKKIEGQWKLFYHHFSGTRR